MAAAVRLSEEIVEEAKLKSKVYNRSIAGQIEYWAKIGKILEENPEFNYEFIKDLLIAQEEVKSNKLSSYKFEI